MLKLRVNEKLGRTVIACPMRRVRGAREETTLVDINCQVTKKRIDRKVKGFFYFFCQTNKGEAQQSQSGRRGCATTKSIDLGGQ